MDLTLTIRYVKQSIKDRFGITQNVRTTLSHVIRLVKERYPGPSEEEIKSALANIEGWSSSPSDVPDQIEITPAFFS